MGERCGMGRLTDAQGECHFDPTHSAKLAKAASNFTLGLNQLCAACKWSLAVCCICFKQSCYLVTAVS